MNSLSLFHRLIVRPLGREPLRTGLTALAIALGVAVVLAIELAGNAAAGSFRSSMEALAGTADFEITSPGGIPPRILATLATLPYDLKLQPRIEDYVVLPASGRTVPFLGIDTVADAPAGVNANLDLNIAANDGVVWAGDGLGLRAGERISVDINDAPVPLAVRGVLRHGSGDVMVSDLAAASRLFDRHGSLDRILIEVPAEKNLEKWDAILRTALPPGITVSRGGARTEENRKMLGAFRWNLRILSYIALVVGAFLIYNTISISVVRRRAEIGIVRALGATRGAVLAAFLAEAATFGIVGALAGIALGRLLAVSAVGMIAATVESLYVSSTPGPIELSTGTVLLALLAGLIVAMGSALLPAWEASRVLPVEAMARGRREHDVRGSKTRSLVAAALCALGALLASRQGPVEGKPLFGYLATVLLIAACTFAIPAMTDFLSRAGSSFAKRFLGPEALLASRGAAASLRRTSVLVAALAAAIAMMSAVAIMVGSFRQTVLVWMDNQLGADLYLRPAGAAAADRHPTLSPEAADALAGLPQVAAVSRFRAYEITFDGSPATLGATDTKVAGRLGHRTFLSGAAPAPILDRLASGDFAVVSEAFANKHGVGPPDVITVSLAGKQINLRVLDIYYDYSSERGSVLIDRSTLFRYLPDAAPSSIEVYLKPGVPLEAGREAVEKVERGRKVMIFTNRTLRTEAIRIFDRTFAITYALEAVAVLVAILGVAGALLALVIDRRREFGLLRFLGGSTAQVRRILLFEAGLLGLFANAAGLILGILLSLLLIYVINKQSFGWTIQFHWPIAMLLGALSAVYLATIGAAIYPGRVAAKLNPIEVVHEE